jgi:hypothetical protein
MHAKGTRIIQTRPTKRRLARSMTPWLRGWLRIGVLIVVVGLIPATQGCGSESSSVTSESSSVTGESSSVTSPATLSCCRVCTKGKACGDSCINVSFTCHKGPGCACNG